MPPTQPNFPRRGFFRSTALTWLVTSASIALSISLWYAAHTLAAARLQERFTLQTNDVIQKVTERVYGYEHMLLGAKGLVQSVPEISRETWAHYAETLGLTSTFPGAMGLGYSARISPDKRGVFEERARTLISPSFSIWPSHQRDELHSILVIEPLDGSNAASVGFDMMTEPTRRAAMKRARDTGMATISGGVRSTDDEAQSSPKGFMMFVPVYAPKLPLENQEDRRIALQGFVFCFFRMDTLLGGMLRNTDTQIDFEVFDLPEALPKHRLYSTITTVNADYTHTSDASIELLGRSWYLRFHGGRSFTSHYEYYIDWYLGGAFTLFNLLLFATLYSLSRQRTQAISLAEEMTSDLRLQMESRRELLDRFEKIASHIPGMVFQFRLRPDKHISFPYASRGIRDIYHIYPEEAALDANSTYTMVHPADLQGMIDSIRLSASTLQPWQHQYRLRYEDGRERWVYGTATPEREADGSTLWHGFITDISALKAAQDEAQHALTELSYQKFAMDQHAIVEITDIRGAISYVNDRFCAITGYSREELIGQTHRLINSGHHTRDFFREMFRTIMRGEVWHGELCNRARNGSVFWVDTTIVPVLRDDKKIDRYVAIRTDITQRKLLETSLAHARDQAFEASRLKSEFLAGMSHEIRTPMNGIIGMGNLLLSTPLDPRQQEMTRVLKSSAESLMRIIDDILDFSKIEAGKLRIDRVPFNLSSLIADITHLLEPRAREKHIEFLINTDPRLDTQLLGDPGRVRQIILNLVGNALKFTERGRVDVESSVLDHKGHSIAVLVSVRDTGIGISEDSQGRLFQPFVQADGTTTRRFGGTGLGLAICRHLVELMGGRIGFSSVPGKGSTFWFELELPLSRGESQAVLPADSGEQAAAVPAGKVGAVKRSLHLLLAEDNPANQVVAKYLLNEMGHRFDLATNGRQVLALIKNNRYDAILMDCQMPELDGYETTGIIRSGHAGEEVRRIPIIALTAYAMQGDREKCLAAGMTDYVTKPIQPEALTLALARCGLADFVSAEEGARTLKATSETEPLPPKEGDSALREDSPEAAAPAPRGTPPSVTPAPAEPAFSESQWKTLANLPGENGRTALDEVLQLFVQHTPARLEQLTAQHTSGDLPALGRTAHTIAGSAASLGATTMQKAALALERAVKGSQHDQIPVLMDTLLKSWEHCQAELRTRKLSPQ